MTVVSYHSTLISHIASSSGAVDNTSSQILLSRGVADPDSVPISSTNINSPAIVTSVFESPTTHVMTVSDAASRPEPTMQWPDINAQCDEDSTVDVHESLPPIATKPLPRQNTFLELTPPAESTSKTKPPPSAQTSAAVQVTEVDKKPEPERGRTLERSPRISDPLARADSRIRLSNATLDVDTHAIKRRVSRSSTFHDDPTAPSAIMDDDLLEPCPHEPLCQTLSEVLNSPISSASFSGSVSRSNSDFVSRQASLVPPFTLFSTFSDHSTSSPPEPIKKPDNETDEDELSDSDEQADDNVPYDHDPAHDEYGHETQKTPAPPQSIAVSLPTEILQQLYYNLSPADFHTARHTCRTWLMASLERSLLETMIRRGGFSSSILQEITANHVLDSNTKTNDEWLISKRLSRECALGPAWTGNGLTTDEDPTNASSNATFTEISMIDFTEVALHYQGTDSVGTVFTVSNCGRFLMAANGCLVYIYELNRSASRSDTPNNVSPGSLRPVTGIICPHRVLACSMDTSSRRYAIAILLEGRMGLVCDITTLNRQQAGASQPNAERIGHSESSKPHGKESLLADGPKGTSFLDRISLNSSASIFNGGIPSTEPPFVFPGIATSGTSFAPANDSEWLDVFQGDMPSSSQTAGPSSRHPSLPRAGKLRQNSRLKSILPPHRELNLGETGMPIETGPRSLYRNLCSDDDPPRSVAICPQRRCVAFGCSSGIELHWVDALTGQDLNRWFPLTAPSDYLYFLPPRRSVDSAKKLRLISSAARPSEQPALAERAFGRRNRNSILWEKLGRATSVGGNSQSAWNRQPFATRISGNASAGRAGFGRTELSDHYRAMPLSDGYHILFTDPVTGLLCLGSDAPVGGPTKLLRKIWFNGPENMGSPLVYTSGSDLKWGVRVVAVFGSEQQQSVWLFSVPADIFTAENHANQSGRPLCTPPDTSKDVQNWDWLDWWPQNGAQEWNNNTQDPDPDLLARSTWPVKITGQEVGKCQGVTDLAIDAGPDMTIWAFSKSGITKVWRINDGRNLEPRIRLVVRDGTIRNVDADGDVEMLNATPLPDSVESTSPLPETFDGTSCSDTLHFPSVKAKRDRIEWSQCSINQDSLGDVLMEDLQFPNSLDDEISDGSFEDVVTGSGVRGRVWYESRGVGRDFVEELTGIARIDIEIR